MDCGCITNVPGRSRGPVKSSLTVLRRQTYRQDNLDGMFAMALKSNARTSKTAETAKSAASNETVDILFCSFCGKSKDAVKTLIAGPTVFICNECVAVCTKFISGEASPEPTDWDRCSDEFLLSQLPRTSAIADAASNHLASHVATLRKREVTWELIGKALGVSRQAAWERFS